MDALARGGTWSLEDNLDIEDDIAAGMYVEVAVILILGGIP